MQFATQLWRFKQLVPRSHPTFSERRSFGGVTLARDGGVVVRLCGGQCGVTISSTIGWETDVSGEGGHFLVPFKPEDTSAKLTSNFQPSLEK